MRCAACGFESQTEGQRFCQACGESLGGAGASGNSRIGLERCKPLAFAALAAVLYLTVVEAAVESFVRGSSLRWYIACGAIVYLTGCAAVWRLKPALWARWSSANQAAASFLILLVLLTATAWLPRGLEDGLRLFGLPTASVLALSSAVVIAICGFLIARLAFVPLPAKIAGGLLSAYGVAAFLLAVKSGTPYASLFHGGSVWAKLPSWLQGAVLGGLLIVPVGLLLELLADLRRSTRAKIPMITFKASALGMSFLIAVAAVRLPADEALVRAPCKRNTSLDIAAPGASGAAAIGSPLRGLFGAATPTGDVAPHEDAPCDRNEDATKIVAAGAADHPTVPAPVAPSTAAPAESALTRLTRLRDSQPKQDMSAITAAHPGSPAELFRFVRDQINLDVYPGAMRGALGAATTRAGNPTDKALLLAALLKSNGANVRFARAALEAPDVDRLVDAARAAPAPTGAGAGVSVARIDEAVAGAPEDRRQILRTALIQANDAAQALSSRADAQSIEVVKALGAAHVEIGNDAQLRADAMRALRDHVWVQLQNGEDWQDLDPSLPTLQPGQRLPSAREVTTSDDLPDDEYVKLEVRIVATRAAKDSSDDADVVVASRRVIDALAQPVTLEVVPDSNVSPEEIASAKSFRARLSIAGEEVGGNSFAVEEPDKGALLALGVVMTVSRPGFDAITYTRSVIDRRDPQGAVAPDWSDMRRVSCALISRFNGLVVTGEITHADYRTRSLNELIELEAARAEHRRPAKLAADFPYAALRYLYRAQLLRPGGARFVIDRPNIVFERSSLDCSSGPLLHRMAIDVVENGQSAIASNATASARANLARGILGELIEIDLMSSRGNRVDTPSIIEAAARANIPLATLHPGDARQLQALALPSMFEHGVASSLATGQIAVVTQRPVAVADAPHVAWWAVDTASGNTIGRVDDGGGQAMMEAGIQHANIVVSIVNLMEFSFSLEGCVWKGALAGLEASEFDVGACMSRVICTLAVEDTMDYGFSMFGMLWELEEKTEKVEFMMNFLELSGGPSVPDALCGGE